jgi:hypothetical protein
MRLPKVYLKPVGELHGHEGHEALGQAPLGVPKTTVLGTSAFPVPRGVPYRSSRATIRKMLAYSVPPDYERSKPIQRPKF